MENNMEKNVEEITETPFQEQTECSGYTDPNEGVKCYEEQQFQDGGYQQNQQPRDEGYRKSRQFENTNYQYSQQFQDQPDQQSRQYQEQYRAAYQQQYYHNYDVRQMDTSPMSMGDWLLTILAVLLPCAGVILYFVWAFGSRGNINRRNYSRAMLIVMGGFLVIYVMIFMITCVIGMDYYYYY